MGRVIHLVRNTDTVNLGSNFPLGSQVDEKVRGASLNVCSISFRAAVVFELWFQSIRGAIIFLAELVDGEEREIKDGGTLIYPSPRLQDFRTHHHISKVDKQEDMTPRGRSVGSLFDARRSPERPLPFQFRHW
jgi:hypothetical protein